MNRKRRMRVGRFTAVLLMITTGVLLLDDALHGTEHLLLLLKWWPLIAVLWGLEYLVLYLFSWKSKGTGRRFQLDLRGILLAVVLSASVFIVTEQKHYLHLWNKVSLNLTAAGVDYSEQEGNSVGKDVIAVPVSMDTQSINVENINGDILVERGPVENIDVQAEIWVDQITGPEADVIGRESSLEVSGDSNITIQTKGKPYGQSGKRQPRMNLTITLPEDRRFDLSLRTMNGGIKLQHVDAIKQISMETASGELNLDHVSGDIKGSTLNGKVNAFNVTGSVDLSTNQGNMQAVDVSDSATLTTQVGNLSVIRAMGKIDARTKNGNIYVDEIRSDFKAESLNGGITARSSLVEGNWDIYSAVGELTLNLPEEGSYEMDGIISYGDIRNQFPEFTVDKKNITGAVGLGEYKVHIEGNSDLNVNKY
ncbi:DUF4097 family beta strand repeat protein [Paenibacillus sp. HJL G12]|uniref:DUF4097 family beta strand repeat protein n=1 Tax=Paenibacillus dendrobii TaxID=2691084 RepID=A0A7X3IPI2_9BACL|nr:DUF4097 family beta strand repeat-containing protein [Paenibacillus dendrobii]MWV47293.1 DUF4097 family beta strand repeat protein [Paenibacillus dendrobii]